MVITVITLHSLNSKGGSKLHECLNLLVISELLELSYSLNIFPYKRHVKDYEWTLLRVIQTSLVEKVWPHM